MVKKVAFLFPGQGSQAVGMGKDLYDNFEAAKNVFDTAAKTLGKSITTICFEGPEEDLKQTVNTQPSIVTMSIAAMEALKSELNINADFVAGHSLGEYCAMHAAGVMDLETTLKLIQKRADYISWDEYFMGVAKLASLRSKDPNSQVGACIVGQDNKILSSPSGKA